MAIDIDADVAAILGSETDLPRTSGTYSAAGGGSSDSVTGVLVERSAERLSDDRSPEEQECLFIIDADEFTNVTVRSIGDTFTPTGELAWTVFRVRARVQHVTLDMRRTVSVGRGP